MAFSGTHNKLNKSCCGAKIKHGKLVKLTKIFWDIYSGTQNLMTAPPYVWKIPLVNCNTPLYDLQSSTACLQHSPTDLQHSPKGLNYSHI